LPVNWKEYDVAWVHLKVSNISWNCPMNITVTYHKPVQGLPKRWWEVSSARRSQGHTHVISKRTHSTLSALKSSSFVILFLRNTQCALFYFLNSRYIGHTVYVTNLFPPRQYCVVNIMASVFSHESACLIPHQCFFVFLVWHDDIIYIHSSLSVLVHQALCVIRIADFRIASF